MLFGHVEYYSSLSRSNVCSLSECLLHFWHAKVASILWVLVCETSDESFPHFFFCLQYSFSFLQCAQLVLSVRNTSLPCVFDGVLDIFHKLHVVNLAGILWTCIVLFNERLVCVAQLEEAVNFIEESLLRNGVASTDLMTANLLS